MSLTLSLGLSKNFKKSFDPTNEDSIIMWWAADNDSNITSTVSADFATTDVNTTTNRVTITLPAGLTRSDGYNAITGQFTTTGTLPSPLQLDTDYIVEDNGDGTATFYPVLTDSDYASIPGYTDGETVLPYHSYSYQAAEIDFTDQGSGTHTFSTDPIATTITDKSGNSVDFVQSPINKCFLVKTDGNGFKYFEKRGALGVNNNNGDAYGKLMDDDLDNTTFGNLFNGKRYMYSVTTAKMKFNTYLSLRRSVMDTSDINTGTGVFTANGHGFTTGNEIKYGALSDGGAFPTPSPAFAANVYVRSRGSNTFSIHPTATDANNDTNVYTYTDSGTGQFYVLDESDIRTAATNRQILYDMNASNNNHDFSPTTVIYRKIFDISASYFLTGGFNGLLNQIGRSQDIGRDFTWIKVKVFIPPGSVAPTCNDTSLPLANGEYYATAQGNSTIRLHRNQTDAENSFGIDADQLTDDDVIKYDLTGASGEIAIHSLEKGRWQLFDDSFTCPSTYPLVSNNTLGVWVCITDFDDPSGNAVYTSGYNDVNNLMDAVESTKGSYSLTGTSQSNINNANADEPHVPAYADEYETVIGVSDSDPSSIVLNIVNWMMGKYQI